MALAAIPAYLAFYFIIGYLKYISRIETIKSGC